jgi:subtilisin family serine protease
MRRAGLVGAVLTLTLATAGPAAATPGPANAPEYWFDSWQVQSLWDSGTRGQGVTIAEIDTGVNADLPELRGRILPGTDLGETGNGHVDREVDPFGHGTAMASIMVARPGLLDITGLAPAAKILPIAVPLDGTTDAQKPDRLPEAIRYAVDHHAKVISMSLGGKRSAGVDTQPCNAAEQSAIYYALRKGSLVIASVGNTGPTRNIIEDPGVCLGVISVGAVDAAGTVAAFSARQPYLTLVAPGIDIPSLGRLAGQAYSGDGTSQATALTSAAAALVWSRHPELDPRGVTTRLLATLDAHRTTPSPAYGYGMLDAYRAVTDEVPADAPNPVFDAVAPFMARADALAQARPKPPKAAAKTLASTGSYEVGSAPRFTAQVVTGIVLAAAGLLLLLLLLIVGVRGRRRRGRAAAAAVGYGTGWPPPGGDGWPPPATSPPFNPPPPYEPSTEPYPADLPRPRPRPGPGRPES